ncbi:MAG: hypothetical protein LBR66_04560, partial [Candidatus Symbiothrix sp.]|nr:hypothetical protein [Candidatus Symbiothrix sp.]
MKKYAGLIIILVIPLIIICVYSFSTLDFSGLRKANISSCFRPLTEIPADTAVSEEIKADTAICDTARQRILFIGDSMLEGLGKRMKYYAGENGHELQYVIWYSSTTKTWAEHIDT